MILVDTTTPQYSGYKLSIYVFGTLQLVLVNMCCYSMPHTPTAHEEATNSGHAMQGYISGSSIEIKRMNFPRVLLHRMDLFQTIVSSLPSNICTLKTHRTLPIFIQNICFAGNIRTYQHEHPLYVLERRAPRSRFNSLTSLEIYDLALRKPASQSLEEEGYSSSNTANILLDVN